MIKKLKIDIVVPPYSGHINPILELIGPLRDKYDFCIYTGKGKINFLREMGYTCEMICPKNPEIFELIVNTSKRTNIFIYFNQFKKNIELAENLMVDLKKSFLSRGTDVVIADFIAIPAGIVSDELKIPWISTLPTPFVIESKNSPPSYFGGLYPKNNFFYKIRDKIGRTTIKFFKKLVIAMANYYIPKLNYKLYNEKGYENSYSSHSILALGMKELEFRQDFPEHLIWTGACLPKEIKGENENFKGNIHNKRVFVTIGTHLLWGKDKLINLIKKIANKYENLDFIISLGNFQGRNELVKKIGYNVFLYEYIDYDDILSNMDYVIHHGGAGILYYCIKYNKPSIIIPHDYDQFDFAVRADLQKIGYVVWGNRKRGIEKALDKIINEKNWNNLYDLSRKYREYNPSEVLEKEIERLVKIKE